MASLIFFARSNVFPSNYSATTELRFIFSGYSRRPCLLLMQSPGFRSNWSFIPGRKHCISILAPSAPGIFFSHPALVTSQGCGGGGPADRQLMSESINFMLMHSPILVRSVVVLVRAAWLRSTLDNLAGNYPPRRICHHPSGPHSSRKQKGESSVKRRPRRSYSRLRLTCLLI